MVEERDGDRTVYNQPAGHVENKESIIDAVSREVKEETAWDFTADYICGLYKWRKQDNDTTFIRICFAGSVTNHQPEQELDDGIISANWLPFEQLSGLDEQRMRSPMVRQCITDFINGTRYPLEFITEW